MVKCHENGIVYFCKNLPNYLKKYTEDIVQTTENIESVESENKESRS